MMSKILFFLLIGCALALDFPVDQDYEYEEEAFDGVAGVIKNIFGKVLEMIKETSQKSLQNAFKEISKRLNTEEYKKKITELQNILQRIYGDDEEPNVAEEDKKAIEQELEMVGAAFGKLVQVALESIQNNNEDKVDTSEFKVTIDNLKILVDKIYAKQGTN